MTHRNQHSIAHIFSSLLNTTKSTSIIGICQGLALEKSFCANSFVYKSLGKRRAAGLAAKSYAARL
jgi:hypothetical protein